MSLKIRVHFTDEFAFHVLQTLSRFILSFLAILLQSQLSGPFLLIFSKLYLELSEYKLYLPHCLNKHYGSVHSYVESSESNYGEAKLVLFVLVTFKVSEHYQVVSSAQYAYFIEYFDAIEFGDRERLEFNEVYDETETLVEKEKHLETRAGIQKDHD